MSAAAQASVTSVDRLSGTVNHETPDVRRSVYTGDMDVRSVRVAHDHSEVPDRVLPNAGDAYKVGDGNHCRVLSTATEDGDAKYRTEVTPDPKVRGRRDTSQADVIAYWSNRCDRTDDVSGAGSVGTEVVPMVVSKGNGLRTDTVEGSEEHSSVSYHGNRREGVETVKLEDRCLTGDDSNRTVSGRTAKGVEWCGRDSSDRSRHIGCAREVETMRVPK